MPSFSKKSLHIFDAIRHVTQKSGNRVKHKMWKSDYFITMTPAGNFKYITPEGELHWDWMKGTHPKTGWEIIDV